MLRRDRRILWPLCRKGVVERPTIVVVAHREMQRQSGLGERADECREILVVLRQALQIGAIAVDEHRCRLAFERDERLDRAGEIVGHVHAAGGRRRVAGNVRIRQQRDEVGIDAGIISEHRAAACDGDRRRGAAGQKRTPRDRRNMNRHRGGS